MKKVIIWALLISISFLTGAIISYHLPKVEAWLITWIEKESREHTPLGMLPERLSLGFFPPQIRMEGIRIIPSKDLKDQLDPFILDSAALKLSWSAFIKGSVRAINLQLSGAEVSEIESVQKAYENYKEKKKMQK